MFSLAKPSQLDIQGLDITVTGGEGKAKGKAKATGTETLVGAKLQLKAGQRYALVGKNGSGKSSKAVAPPRPWKGQAKQRL